MRYFFILSLLAACSTGPNLPPITQAPAEGTGDYPRLVPLETLLNTPDPQITPDFTASMQSRVAALKARAARLRAIRM
ncbi:hypothetical protein [Pseudoprimorskyibacter insulae]|uniref:Uncharacterized protein n=1 Tax=Pseudoprimorskyibacter insulae TaxID=1695997 RepID=A0A2R8AR00_9RHOB|nr:hypothetical protein [Pseudoprimorskyibacter insulae]SPF78264.1 hypothetical protein PRI8871_00859 [Pseudoprimorskyibacter insulae]